MRQRGRKSAASLSVVPCIDLVPQRPAPLPEFTAAEAEIWNDAVGAMSREWFASAGTHVLLPHFCFAVMFSDLLAAALRLVDIADLDRIEMLVTMYARHTAVLVRLATKLRLTPAARDPFARTALAAE